MRRLGSIVPAVARPTWPTARRWSSSRSSCRLFVLLLLGMLEFGFMFDHHITLGYASREGARVGSALANGGGQLGCGAGRSPNADLVDPQVIAAVQRVLTSPGSLITLGDDIEIRIFKADARASSSARA